HKAFRHLKKLEKTENKVNVLKVYRKKQVMPKRSSCENIEKNAKGDLKAQIRLVTCYQERSETKKKNSNSITEFERIKKDKKKTCFNSSENHKFDDGKTQRNKIRRSQSKEEKKIETVSIGCKKIVDGKDQNKRNNKLLTGDREGRKVEEPTGRTSDRIYKTGYKVKKNEDKEVKRIEPGQKKKKRTKISPEREALICVYKKKGLVLDDDMEAIENFKNSSIQLGDQFQGSIKEDSSKNNDRKGITKKKLNHINTEDNNSASKFDQEYLKKEAISHAYEKWNRGYKKIDKLSELNKKVTQNVEYAKKGMVVVPEVGDISKYMNVIENNENKMKYLLFDPGGSILLKTQKTNLESKSTHLQIQLLTSCDIVDIYVWKYKIKWGDLSCDQAG
ncbi:17830_t:CDS:2, partial [Gigaspora margarita]